MCSTVGIRPLIGIATGSLDKFSRPLFSCAPEYRYLVAELGFFHRFHDLAARLWLRFLFPIVILKETLKDLKSDYNIYEDILFGKIKESVYFAASYPFATTGLVVGSGVLAVKSTRRALYYNTLRVFLSNEEETTEQFARVIDAYTTLHEA